MTYYPSFTPFFKRSMRNTMLGLAFLIVLVTASVWILFFRGTARLRNSEGVIFGTTYHIRYESAQPLDSAILDELRRVDASLSIFNGQSTLSLINNGKTNKADAMVYEVLEKANKVSEATKGAFDVTVMPLVNAWGFGFKHGSLPSESQIDSLRELVGYQRVTLMPDSIVRKDDGRMTIDCGAIAKGYAVDRVARLLQKAGVRNFMVEIGGEVVTRGRNPEGRLWQIGVSKPTDGSQELQTIISLENAALATSGNYRNFYVANGKKYAHTIDPRTGRSVQHSLLSATVSAPDCATADAYATAFMVLGLEESTKIVRENKHLKALFIFSDKNGKMRTRKIRLATD